MKKIITLKVNPAFDKSTIVASIKANLGKLATLCGVETISFLELES